ncbi:MAG: hypothetical protein ABI643_01340 [Candidatus Doudnabacteria bacterium]
MNELTDNTNIINNPEQAVDQFMGEQFIEWLMDHISRQIKAWPAVIRIKAAKPRPEKIKKFMLQKFLAAEAFLGAREGDPGFLRFAIANLSESDDPTAESALEILDKKRQEDPEGTAHRALWQYLLLALGLKTEDIGRAVLKEQTRNYIAEMSDVYSSSEWQTAVGAYAAAERAVKEENLAILEMLKKNTALGNKDLEILSTQGNSGANYVVNSSHILDKIVFDRDTKQLVWEGVKRQLETRKEFLSGLAAYLEG